MVGEGGGGWKRVEGGRGWRMGEGGGKWERVEEGGRSGEEGGRRWKRVTEGGRGGIPRCPKAICGHRFSCPVVSVLIFSLQIFDVNRAAAPKGAMSLLSGLVTLEDWLYLSGADLGQYIFR